MKVFFIYPPVTTDTNHSGYILVLSLQTVQMFQNEDKYDNLKFFLKFMLNLSYLGQLLLCYL